MMQGVTRLKALMILCLMSLFQLPVFASVIYTATSASGLSVAILDPVVVGCFPGFPCVMPWTISPAVTLTSGTTTSFSAFNPGFVYELGNHLSGIHEVSLSPAYRNPAINLQDELRAIVADDSQLLGQTDMGVASFNAVDGTPYYLLLAGIVRDDTVYELSVFQVPEPHAGVLIGFGLVLLSLRRIAAGCAGPKTGHPKRRHTRTEWIQPA